MIVIDATDSIMGRVATYAAKQALLGNQVRIINSEKAVISGKKMNVFNNYLSKMELGTPLKGPYLHRSPERILRRSVRGMLPYKKPRGKAAYKRVLCYIGVPKDFKGEKVRKLDDAHISKLPSLKYVDLMTLSKRLGAKLD